MQVVILSLVALGALGLTEAKGTDMFPFCFLPVDQGEPECDSWKNRWHYSEEHGDCVKFRFSGCGGNENNFAHITDCQLKCQAKFLPKYHGERDDRCFLPKAVGRGYAELPRYFYNDISNSCERFVYRGSGGNANNFPNRHLCQKVCG